MPSPLGHHFRMSGEGSTMRSLGDCTAHLRAHAATRARRLFAVAAVAALALAGAAAVTGTAPAGAVTAARARAAVTAPATKNDPTASFNDMRNGWDRNEPTLTP